MGKKLLEFFSEISTQLRGLLSGWVECPLTWRGERWGHLLGPAHPLGVVAPLLYIERWRASLNCSFTCPFAPLFSHLPKIHGLGEALQYCFLHHHHTVVPLEVPVDPLLLSAEALPDCGAHLHHDLEIGKWSSTPPIRTVLIDKNFGLQGWVLLDHSIPIICIS
jgi:hypothetical protein